ncbi:MAG: hypothetical protein P8175_10710 [Deltaproteobacteria bacterium]|jgi:hypothetical protein
MEAVNIADNFEEAYEEYEQQSLLSVQSVIPEEILPQEDGPNRFFKGLFFALPISVLLWGIAIWIFL